MNQCGCFIVEGYAENVFITCGVSKSFNNQSLIPTSIKALRKRGIHVSEHHGTTFDFSEYLGSDFSSWEPAVTSYLNNLESEIVNRWRKGNVNKILSTPPTFFKLNIKRNTTTSSQIRNYKEDNLYDGVVVKPYHVPALSQMYSVLYHITSQAAAQRLQKKLSKLKWNNETIKAANDLIQKMTQKLDVLRMRMFNVIHETRSYIHNQIIKTPFFFRYMIAQNKVKNSENILDNVYNLPENNTGDLVNGILSEVTHGKSMFHTPFSVLYHRTQGKQPITRAQKQQIFGRCCKS